MFGCVYMCEFIYMLASMHMRVNVCKIHSNTHWIKAYRIAQMMVNIPIKGKYTKYQKIAIVKFYRYMIEVIRYLERYSIKYYGKNDT